VPRKPRSAAKGRGFLLETGVSLLLKAFSLLTPTDICKLAPEAYKSYSSLNRSEFSCLTGRTS
jgi:hypothetical protein